MEDTQTHDTSVIREKQADEVCDIYDIYGNRTGKTSFKREKSNAHAEKRHFSSKAPENIAPRRSQFSNV